LSCEVLARRIRVAEGELRIGRWEGNDIVLPSQKVSRVHAVLSCQGAFATIKDAHSTNGTFVNGTRIDSMPVLDGDRLQFADVELLFCHMDDPTAEFAQARPAPAAADAAATDLAGLAPTASPSAYDDVPTHPSPRRAEPSPWGRASPSPFRCAAATCRR
jgi:hypothetical protein